MLEGVPPYRLIYNMKMPGIYAAYALIMAVFGQSSPRAFAWVSCWSILAAIVLLYFVGRRFLGPRGRGGRQRRLCASCRLSPARAGLQRARDALRGRWPRWGRPWRSCARRSADV